MGRQELFSRIKNIVYLAEPSARVILYGSYARGDNRPESDIDLLILVNKDQITLSDERRIRYPLYDIEFESGTIISPVIFTENEWNTTHSITPFHENVTNEGRLL